MSKDRKNDPTTQLTSLLLEAKAQNEDVFYDLKALVTSGKPTLNAINFMSSEKAQKILNVGERDTIDTFRTLYQEHGGSNIARKVEQDQIIAEHELNRPKVNPDKMIQNFGQLPVRRWKRISLVIIIRQMFLKTLKQHRRRRMEVL